MQVDDILDQHPNTEAVKQYRIASAAHKIALNHLDETIDHARELLEQGRPVGPAQALAYQSVHQAYGEAAHAAHKAFHDILGIPYDPNDTEHTAATDLVLFIEQTTGGEAVAVNVPGAFTNLIENGDQRPL